MTLERRRSDGGLAPLPRRRKNGDTLAIALQIATVARPQEGASLHTAYTEALEANVQAQSNLIDALREEIAAKDDLLTAKDAVIDVLAETVADSNRGRLACFEGAQENFRRLGIHFREIADTARNIQDALRATTRATPPEPACIRFAVHRRCGRPFRRQHRGMRLQCDRPSTDGRTNRREETS